MIRNHIQPHIHNILTHNGGAIALDVFFKHDYKLRIISVYLSSTNSSDQKATQDKVKGWIQQALATNLHPIILGDFNANNDTTISSATKYQLLNYLHSINLYDLANYSNNTHSTWQSTRYQNRIDYIWANDSLISYLHKFELDNSLSSTNSDHQILISTWKFPFAISKIRNKNRCKRRTYNYKSMTKENWEEFTNQVKTNMTDYRVPTTTDTTESLEHTWHKIDTCIIKAALKHIPNKKYTIKNFFHTFTPKATQLHNDLKTIRHILHHVKKYFSNNTTMSNNIQSLINQINTIHNFNIKLPSHHQSDLATWIQETKLC